jgi:hypothetical protein
MIDEEGLLLLLSFDAKHVGKTAQLAAYQDTVKSLEGQPFAKQKFIDECISSYKIPTDAEITAHLAKKSAVEGANAQITT